MTTTARPQTLRATRQQLGAQVGALTTAPSDQAAAEASKPWPSLINSDDHTCCSDRAEPSEQVKARPRTPWHPALNCHQKWQPTHTN